MYCIYRNSSPVEVQVWYKEPCTDMARYGDTTRAQGSPHKTMYMHACESEYNCVVTLLYCILARTKLLNYVLYVYRTAQNFGGRKLWRIQ